MSQEPVQIDGSYGEGGGQVIRTSLSLAALTGRAVEMTNIRARRTRPGLQPQHLTAVRAAAALCDAVVSGDSIGSATLRFAPQRPITPGQYRFDIGTAGATTLVLQTALAPLATAAGSSQVVVTGGTHVSHAPPVEYLEAAYLPALRRMGIEAQFRYPSAGFFPRGGGEAHLDVQPVPNIAPIALSERGKLQSLRAYVVTAGLPEHVAQRGAARVEKWLKGVGRRAEIELRERPSAGPGAAVVLIATCENGYGGFVGLGERGKPTEQVAEAPCEAFMRWWKSGATCDEHLATSTLRTNWCCPQRWQRAKAAGPHP